MFFFQRVILVIGLLFATCDLIQAQTTVYQPQTVDVPPSPEYQDRNPPGWVSGGDPVGIPGEKGEILDPRFYPPPGWFTNIDLGVVKPHLENQVHGQVSINGGVDTVQLPTAPLEWTATPRVGLGYRFPNAGELILSYQSLISSGTTSLPNFDAAGNGSLHSRLNMNVATFDWVSLENSFGPNWGMKWHGGIVYTNTYFDSTARGQIVTQRTSGLLNTAGVRAGLDLSYALPPPGLSLFGRLDGMFMIGPAQQVVEETIRATDGSQASSRSTDIVNAVPLVLTLEGGVSYAPPSMARWLRLTAGYHFEQWWDLGFPLFSDAQLTIQGIFLRAEITY